MRTRFSWMCKILDKVDGDVMRLRAMQRFHVGSRASVGVESEVNE